MNRPPIPHIVSQHAEEAAFLWLLRDAAVGEPHYNLQDLARLDERVEAHLDGLRVAGDVGWDVTLEQLGHMEPGEVFSAGVLAFGPRNGAPNGKRMEQVIGPVYDAHDKAPELRRPLISALGRLPFELAAPLLDAFTSSDEPWLMALGLAGYRVHRRFPEGDIKGLMQHASPLLRREAMRLAGEIGYLDCRGVLGECLGDDDALCRFHAARALLLLGSDAGVDVLRGFSYGDADYAEEAIALLAVSPDRRVARDWLRELSERQQNARLLIKALGLSGDPAMLDSLFEYMQDSGSARLAGEAVEMITGVDIAYLDLDAQGAKDEHDGPRESPADEDVALDPDEDLPWPDPEALQHWWRENAGRFSDGEQYFLGRPACNEVYADALSTARQRARRVAAAALALADASSPLFEIRAEGSQQLSVLGPRSSA
jgi:uncharacterized protein (TIGR02270 family)